jgi:excisionase family DNA binding protein
MDKTKEISNNEPKLTHLLKPMEVAEILGISRSHVYKMLQLGEIPNVIIGKSRRVRPEDLIEYINKNTYYLNQHFE